MELRLHRRGRFRGWLGHQLGGDAELGDRVWRRILHLLGAGVLLYYLLPPRFFFVLTTEEILLLALFAVLVLEALRQFAGLQLPTIRPYEEGRLASYAFYAIAIVVAVLLFPEPVATVVVLGTAIVDPLVGELRLRTDSKWAYPVVPILVYAAIGATALVEAFRWSALPAVGVGLGLGAVAVVIERPKYPLVDDDIAMTLIPGMVFLALLYGLPGISAWGPR